MLSGGIRAVRIRRHQRDRGRRAGDVAGVRPDRRQRLRAARAPRTTMNAQRCWFFELWARRPASTIRSRSAVASGRPSNDRIARLVRTASRTFIPGSSRRGRERDDGLVADDVSAVGPGGVRGSPFGRHRRGRFRRRARATATGSRRAPRRASSAAPGPAGARPGRPRRPRPPPRASSGPPRLAARNRATAARYAGNSYSHECRPPSTTSVSVTASGRAARRARGEPREIADRHHAVLGPVDQHHRPVDGAHGAGRAHGADRVAARPKEDAGSSATRAATRSAPGSAAARGGTSGGSAGTGRRASTPRPPRSRHRSSAAATSAPAPPIEWPSSADRRDLRVGARSPATAARASAAYSPTDIGRASGPFAPCPRTSKVRTWNPAACRTWAWGSVRSRADSQPWTRTTPGRRRRAGGHEPAGQAQAVGRSGSRSRRTRGPTLSGVQTGGCRCG